MTDEQLRTIAQQLAIERASRHGGGAWGFEGGPTPSRETDRYFGVDDYADVLVPQARYSDIFPPTHNGSANGHMAAPDFLYAAAGQAADLGDASDADSLGSRLWMGLNDLALGVGSALLALGEYLKNYSIVKDWPYWLGALVICVPVWMRWL